MKALELNQKKHINTKRNTRLLYSRVKNIFCGLVTSEKYLLFAFLSILFIVSSCKKESALSHLEGQTMSLDNFFAKVSSTDIQTADEGSGIYVTYKWNKNDNTITIESTIEKEPDFFILDFNNEDDTPKTDAGSKTLYTVTCTKGGKDVWSQTCNGSFSCGKLVVACLEEKACATVCKNGLIYMPQNKTFYLLDDDSDDPMY